MISKEGQRMQFSKCFFLFQESLSPMEACVDHLTPFDAITHSKKVPGSQLLAAFHLNIHPM